jgi:hypothetical protein
MTRKGVTVKKAKKRNANDLTDRNENHLEHEIAVLRRRVARQGKTLRELKEVVDAQGVMLSGLTKSST